MKISVIVPVYNVRKYIESCCDSVFHQTYQNYELILVDDGSSDGSGALCDQIVQKLPSKSIAVHTVNQGPLLARQTGIYTATGDIITFLDADDCIRRDALEILANCFSSTGCDIALFNASNKEDYSDKAQRFPWQHGFSMKEEEKCSLYRMITHSKIPNSVCIKAAKKRCFEDFPDFTDLSYVRYGEDLLMSLYMFTAAQKIVYLDENLYFYRQHEGSAVHRFHPNRTKSIKTVHQEMERFIDLWGMPELHPAHFAREVRGWVETLRILLDNRSNMKPAQFRQELRDMATDPFFLRAYELMDPTVLSGKCKLFAKWLRNKRFFTLYMVSVIKGIKTIFIK